MRSRFRTSERWRCRKEPLRIPICRELMLTDEVRVRAKSLVDGTRTSPTCSATSPPGRRWRAWSRWHLFSPIG